MANLIYNKFKGEVGGASIFNWADNTGITIKALLVTSTYVPDKDLHEFLDDVTNEITGTGYTQGGKAITNRSITVDNATDMAKYDGDDVQWLDATFTARGAVVYMDTGTPATSLLVAYLDFGVDKSIAGGSFTLQFGANGVFYTT